MIQIDHLQFVLLAKNESTLPMTIPPKTSNVFFCLQQHRVLEETVSVKFQENHRMTRTKLSPPKFSKRKIWSRSRLLLSRIPMFASLPQTPNSVPQLHQINFTESKNWNIRFSNLIIGNCFGPKVEEQFQCGQSYWRCCCYNNTQGQFHGLYMWFSLHYTKIRYLHVPKD